jgi:RNA polymerase sigma factor (sigma-70 family)
MAEIESALLDSLNTFLAFARKRLNDPELAADAVHDAVLKALKSPDAPSDQEKLVPWFYQILRRTIIDLYRRKATRSEALENFAKEQSLIQPRKNNRSASASGRSSRRCLVNMRKSSMLLISKDANPSGWLATSN